MCFCVVIILYICPDICAGQEPCAGAAGGDVQGMNARIDEQFHVQVINAPMEALRLKYKPKSKSSLIFRHPGERPSQNLRDEMDLKPNTIFIRDREELLEVPPEGEGEGYLTLVLTPLEEECLPPVRLNLKQLVLMECLEGKVDFDEFVSQKRGGHPAADRGNSPQPT